MPKFKGMKMVRVEPCMIVKKKGLLIPVYNRRDYATANIGKVLSTGPYEGEYVVYQRMFLRKVILDGDVVFTVPTDRIVGVIEPEENEEVILQKDMPSLRHDDDKTI